MVDLFKTTAYCTLVAFAYQLLLTCIVFIALYTFKNDRQWLLRPIEAAYADQTAV